MRCPCIKCPVIAICRQRVFAFLEQKWGRANDERHAVLQFIFENSKDQEYGRAADCELLVNYCEMKIDTNKETGHQTYGIQTERIEEIAKALGFDVKIRLG